jgi:AcrR family transcriptional regulator
MRAPEHEGALGLIEASVRVEGLRARKKRERRAAIAAHALALFSERGFEAVTIRDVARRADVSEQTVFNYFPTKEALVFQDEAEREARLIDDVLNRDPSESFVAAVRRGTRHVLRGFWHDDLQAWIRVVESSPALQQHRREFYARLAGRLAARLAAERGAPEDDILCHVATRAMLDVLAAVAEIGGRRVVAGQDPSALKDDLAAEMARAFDALERGLASCGPPLG